MSGFLNRNMASILIGDLGYLLKPKTTMSRTSNPYKTVSRNSFLLFWLDSKWIFGLRIGRTAYLDASV